jgi:hypothetical protein
MHPKIKLELIDTLGGRLAMVINLALMILVVLVVGSVGILGLKKWKPSDRTGSADHCPICAARRLRLLPSLAVNSEGVLPGVDRPGTPTLNQI